LDAARALGEHATRNIPATMRRRRRMVGRFKACAVPGQNAQHCVECEPSEAAAEVQRKHREVAFRAHVHT
jgi:hypothetical protein